MAGGMTLSNFKTEWIHQAEAKVAAHKQQHILLNAVSSHINMFEQLQLCCECVPEWNS